jgi:hypothetical protein
VTDERYEKAMQVLFKFFPTGWPEIPRGALMRILDQHKPVTVYTPTPHCRVCGSLPWPCATAHLVLDAVLDPPAGPS